MNLGKLDRQITLEQAAETRNGYGEVLKDWAPLGTVWAQVRYAAGTETTDNAQVQAVQRVEFTVRYRPDALHTRFRVQYAGNAYEIEAVAEIGRRQGLKLTAYTRS